MANDKLVLTGHLHAWDMDNPEKRMTRLVMLDHGEWDELGDLPDIVSSLIYVEENNNMAFYVLLRNGVLHKWVDGEHSVEIIDESESTFFFELRKIGTHLYACGACQRVFRREAQAWVPIDKEIYKGDRYKFFFSIDGHSEDDIYTVGSGGIIFHYDGHHWEQLESPTNSELSKIRCINGENYISGFGGLFLRGDIKGWELLARDADNHDLNDMEFFGERFYIGSEFRLMTYNEAEGSLDPVKIPIKGELGFGTLCSGYGQLWSIGDETILRFDGKEWTRFEYPDNKPLPEKKKKQ